MSNFEPQEKFGALFRNTKKTDDKQPDYRGNIKIGGDLYNLVAWVKEGKNGKFLSMKVDTTELKPKAPVQSDESGNDLPF